MNQDRTIGDAGTSMNGRACQSNGGRQRGAVLVLTIVVLVAMMLAALALVRSVDTGNLVAGNLAFKQSAAAAADAGTEAAIAWLRTVAGSAALHQDQSAFGYYASSQPTLDVTGTSGDAQRPSVDWQHNACGGDDRECVKPARTFDAGAGNKATYIVHRLCGASGDPYSPANSCADYLPPSSASINRDAVDYAGGRAEGLPSPYYRIITRVDGPRNTVSYIESIVHF